MRKLSIITSMICFIIFFGVVVSVAEIATAQGYRGPHEGKGFWADLTEEQRDAVREKKEEMRSHGATREEIRAAVDEMLKGYGIEVPENWRPSRDPGGFGHGLGPFAADLTDEQKEAVHQKIKLLQVKGADREQIREEISQMLEGYGIEVPEDWGEADHFCHPWGEFRDDLTDEQKQAIREKAEEIKSQGGTREEIHTAVTEMLKGYGIEPPENWRGPMGFGHPPNRFWDDLTDEQREAIKEKTKKMRDQDATREEIHTTVAEMLKGYGIEVPEEMPGPFGFGHPRGGFWDDLTDEQREAIREKTKTMRDQDASPEEIHTAIAEMLKSYGVEVPDDFPGPHGPFGFGADLTDEQREAVREKIKEMRSQGATHEEIRAAIDQMIEGFGIESSEDNESMSAETTPAETQITAGSYPNPFNPETQINYSLATSGKVRISIYNISGQLIRSFDMGYQSPGSYSVRWDGRNESGDITASGVYLYRIEAGSYNVTNRMVLLK
jgi:uncharacterized membrane-anchored protein